MPSGTAHTAASTKPPMTRQTVIAMSPANPNCVNSDQPSRSIVTGSARNVFDTKPPKVAALHAATNSTKNAIPSTALRPDAMGLSGVIASCATARPQAFGSLDEAGVGERAEIGNRLEDADLEQQVRGFL